MAKTFGSREIEARLKSSNSSSASSPQGPKLSGNVLFVSLLSSIFAIGITALIAAGGGDYLGFGNTAGEQAAAKESFKSRVAAECDIGWKDDRINIDQLHCYLSRDIARLCEPRERRALAHKVRAYYAASDRAEVKMNYAALNIIANPNKVASGVSDARSRDPNLSAEEREAQLKKTFDTAQGIMAPADKVIMESVNNFSAKTLVADIKELVELGYLDADDFGGKPPKLILKGLAAAHNPAPPHLCKSAPPPT